MTFIERSGDHAALASADRPPAEAPTGGVGPAPSRAFRIVSWIGALFMTAAFGFGVTEIVLMWLPDDAVAEMLGESNPFALDFRGHFVHVGVVACAVLAPVLVQLKRPQDRVAPLLQGCLGWIAAMVLGVICGSVEAPDVVVLAAFALIAAFHPARRAMFRRPDFDRWQIAVLTVGLIPWLVRVGDGVRDARDVEGLPDVGDAAAHVVAANVPIAIVVMLIAALVGATDHSGWRLPAWTAGSSSVLLGAHALVFPEQPASVPTPWAMAAVVWGVAYLVATVVRERRAVRTS